MVNPEKVHGLIRNLEKTLEQLREIAQLEKGAFLANAKMIGAAKYFLQRAIEACIDIGNHLISSEKFRAPRDYRDVFTVLEENSIITDKDGFQLRRMAGLRNRLVHLYWEVDDAMIYEYIQVNLDDFERYIVQILEFMRYLKQ